MDDTAASQQLIDEAGARRGGHSETSPGSSGEDGAEVLSLRSTPDSDHLSSPQTLPGSLPSFVRKLRLENMNALRDEPVSMPISSASTPSTPRRIEVPDSQLAPARGSGRSTASPVTSPEPSSFVIPASAPKSLLYKKGRKRLRDEVDATEQHVSDDHEDTATGAAGISTASAAPQNKRRRGKKSYVTPPSTGSGSEQAGATSEQETSTIPSVPNVVEDAPTTTPLLRKTKNLARKSTGQTPLSYSVDAGNGAAGDEVSVDRLPPIKRLKKSKLSKLTAQPIDQESGSELSNDAPEVVPMDLAAEQTSVKPNSAEKTGNLPLVLKRRKSIKKKAGAEVTGDQPGPDAKPQDTDFAKRVFNRPAPSATPKGKWERKPLEINTPRRSFTQKSKYDTTRAERELNTFRDLNMDPERPSSGPFTEDENELLRRAIRDYQQRNGLDVDSLVSIIQWADPTFDAENPKHRADFTEEEMEEYEESKAFWDEILNSQPSLNRSRERVKVHVHAQFSSAKKGAWTPEEEEKLTQLVGQYGKKWKTIALFMEDRDPIDCLNRYKDYLQFGDSRNVGRWTAKEESLLLKALTAFIQKDENKRDAAQLSPRAEYITDNIAWDEVVKQMGGVRSRLQCSWKWNYMKAQGIEAANIRPVYRRGRTPDPNQPADETPKKDKAPAKPRGKQRKSEIGGDKTDTKTPKVSKASRKSTALIDSENGVQASASTKRRGRPSKSEAGSGRASTKKPKKASKSGKPKEVAADMAHGGDIDDEIPDTPQIEEAGTPTREKENGDENPDTPYDDKAGTPARDEGNAEEEDDVSGTPLHSGNAATPASRQSWSVLQTPTVGLEQMRLGDKFDLITKIAEDVSITNEEDVDWRKISEDLNNTWSARVLQAAFGELLATVEPQNNFIGTVMELLTRMVEESNHAELKEHYNPFDMGSLGEGIERSTKGGQSAKKRKGKQGHGAKRRKRGSLQAMKSAVFVTEEDDAEDEQEV
jgi:hypothetical protein